MLSWYGISSFRGILHITIMNDSHGFFFNPFAQGSKVYEIVIIFCLPLT